MDHSDLWTPQNSIDTLRASGMAAQFFKSESEAVKRIRSKKFCGAPGCSNNKGAVKAHAIQRGVYLESIASKGKIYSTLQRGPNLAKKGKELSPTLISIREASTFYGFCSDHDNSLFEPIEDGTAPVTNQLLFLHAYRALVSQLWWSSYNFERLRSHHGLAKLKLMSPLVSSGPRIGSRYEEIAWNFSALRHLKYQFDNVLTAEEWGRYQSVYFPTKIQPTVLCSLPQAPTTTFDGQLTELTRESHPASPFVFVHTHPLAPDQHSLGFISFGWLDITARFAEPFVHSYDSLDAKEKYNRLIRLLFHQHGTIAIKPEWWDGQESQTQSALLKSWRTTSLFHPQSDRSAMLDSTALPSTSWGIGSATWPNQ